jgi:hypothetical protein
VKARREKTRRWDMGRDKIRSEEKGRERKGKEGK